MARKDHTRRRLPETTSGGDLKQSVFFETTAASCGASTPSLMRRFRSARCTSPIAHSPSHAGSIRHSGAATRKTTDAPRSGNGTHHRQPLGRPVDEPERPPIKGGAEAACRGSPVRRLNKQCTAKAWLVAPSPDPPLHRTTPSVGRLSPPTAGAHHRPGPVAWSRQSWGAHYSQHSRCCPYSCRQARWTPRGLPCSHSGGSKSPRYSKTQTTIKRPPVRGARLPSVVGHHFGE